MNEFTPLENLRLLFRFWWALVAASLAGGLCGYLYHLSQPPIYEATVNIYAGLDFSKIQVELTQYDEDVILAVVHGALLDNTVLQTVSARMADKGILVTPQDLLANSVIERKHALWELHYRHLDPQTAYEIATCWAQLGYEKMISFQEAKIADPIIVFGEPTPTSMPQKPVVFDQGKLIFAGGFLGLIIGIFGIHILTWIKRN